MTWPDELELRLTAMAQGGDAVGHHDGRAVFASGGLPNELVQVRLRERQQGWARGRVLKVLEPSSERVASFCPLETVCGAADWRWIDYAAQLHFKAGILRDQLRHLGGINVEVQPPPVQSTTTTEYRTTAELHIHGQKIGYYTPGSRRVANLPACCLHHPLINTALATLRRLMDVKGITLRGVTIRCSPSDGTVLGIIDGRGNLRELAQRWRQACPELVGVARASDSQALAGQTWLERQVAGISFRVGARSFFQINYTQLEHLVDRVKTLLASRPNTRLLDLYCGTKHARHSLRSGRA
jgi:23S rRNA (uracil1939-C5)-methyltransferase